MEATKLLKRDHTRVKTLFDKYEKQGDRALQTKQEIFEQLHAELDVHSRIEEEIFYPFVKGIRSSELEEMVAESVEEHIVIKRLLSELKSLSPDVEEFDAKMSVLKENVLHHAEEEEEQKMFPLVVQNASLEERDRIGLEMEARKETLEKGWSGVVADWFKNLVPQAE